jgi:hypothetical protein
MIVALDRAAEADAGPSRIQKRALARWAQETGREFLVQVAAEALKRSTVG